MISSYDKRIQNFTISIKVISLEPPNLKGDIVSSGPNTKRSSDNAYVYNYTVLDDIPLASIDIQVPVKLEKIHPITKLFGGLYYFYAFANVTSLKPAKKTKEIKNIAIIWDSSFSCKNRDTSKDFQLL